MKNEWPQVARPCSGKETLALKSPSADKARMEPPTLPADPIPTQDEKNLALIMHVLSLVGFSLIGPLIVWLIKKDESAFIDKQGRELLNFQISLLIYVLICIPLCFILIGIPMLFAVGIASLILTIIGLIRATEGKIYRFPLTIRML
ncbi:MAG: hypothetical protein RL444_1655 [Verrucomicrobiota bacterium]|jgi:uncharacterized Tic20 family protein